MAVVSWAVFRAEPDIMAATSLAASWVAAARSRRRIVQCGQAMGRLSVEADVVLDDQVVQVRRGPEQHLANDVNDRHVFGVDRRGAAGARGEEEIFVRLGD